MNNLEVEYNGIKMKADILGEFKVEDKEYAVCSYEDDQDNHKIVIVQIEKKEGIYYTKDIPDEDIDKVLSYYNEIKKKLEQA